VRFRRRGCWCLRVEKGNRREGVRVGRRSRDTRTKFVCADFFLEKLTFAHQNSRFMCSFSKNHTRSFQIVCRCHI
jgi:hypothetical protein